MAVQPDDKSTDDLSSDDPHKVEKMTQRDREGAAKPEGDEAAEGES